MFKFSEQIHPHLGVFLMKLRKHQFTTQSVPLFWTLATCGNLKENREVSEDKMEKFSLVLTH